MGAVKGDPLLLSRRFHGRKKWMVVSIITGREQQGVALGRGNSCLGQSPPRETALP